MRISFLLLFTLLLFIAPIKGQTQESPGMSSQNLYFDFGTNIIFSSATINFEQKFASVAEEYVNFYGRVGFAGVLSLISPSGSGGLAAISMITGKRSLHIELSAGAFIGYGEEINTGGTYTEPAGPGTIVLPLFDLGLRFQKPGNSFIFRLKAGVLGFGIGLGYAF